MTSHNTNHHATVDGPHLDVGAVRTAAAHLTCRGAITQCLAELASKGGGAATAAEVWQLMGGSAAPYTEATVRRIMHKLAASGQLARRGKGTYAL